MEMQVYGRRVMLRQQVKRGGFCSDCKRDYKTDTGYYEHKCRGGN